MNATEDAFERVRHAWEKARRTSDDQEFYVDADTFALIWREFEARGWILASDERGPYLNINGWNMRRADQGIEHAKEPS
jgi:hypothetical protein